MLLSSSCFHWNLWSCWKKSVDRPRLLLSASHLIDSFSKFSVKCFSSAAWVVRRTTSFSNHDIYVFLYIVMVLELLVAPSIIFICSTNFAFIDNVLIYSLLLWGMSGGMICCIFYLCRALFFSEWTIISVEILHSYSPVHKINYCMEPWTESYIVCSMQYGHLLKSYSIYGVMHM